MDAKLSPFEVQWHPHGESENRSLDGAWWSGRSICGIIQGNVLTWPDGEQVPIVQHAAGLSFVHEGAICSANADFDRECLRWSDGDVWHRGEERSDDLRTDAGECSVSGASGERAACGMDGLSRVVTCSTSSSSTTCMSAHSAKAASRIVVPSLVLLSSSPVTTSRSLAPTQEGALPQGTPSQAPCSPSPTWDTRFYPRSSLATPPPDGNGTSPGLRSEERDLTRKASPDSAPGVQVQPSRGLLEPSPARASEAAGSMVVDSRCLGIRSPLSATGGNALEPWQLRALSDGSSHSPSSASSEKHPSSRRIAGTEVAENESRRLRRELARLQVLAERSNADLAWTRMECGERGQQLRDASSESAQLRIDLARLRADVDQKDRLLRLFRKRSPRGTAEELQQSIPRERQHSFREFESSPERSSSTAFENSRIRDFGELPGDELQHSFRELESSPERKKSPRLPLENSPEKSGSNDRRKKDTEVYDAMLKMCSGSEAHDRGVVLDSKQARRSSEILLSQVESEAAELAMAQTVRTQEFRHEDTTRLSLRAFLPLASGKPVGNRADPTHDVGHSTSHDRSPKERAQPISDARAALVESQRVEEAGFKAERSSLRLERRLLRDVEEQASDFRKNCEELEAQQSHLKATNRSLASQLKSNEERVQSLTEQVDGVARQAAEDAAERAHDKLLVISAAERQASELREELRQANKGQAELRLEMEQMTAAMAQAEVRKAVAEEQEALSGTPSSRSSQHAERSLSSPSRSQQAPPPSPQKSKVPLTRLSTSSSSSGEASSSSSSDSPPRGPQREPPRAGPATANAEQLAEQRRRPGSDLSNNDEDLQRRMVQSLPEEASSTKAAVGSGRTSGGSRPVQQVAAQSSSGYDVSSLRLAPEAEREDAASTWSGACAHGKVERLLEMGSPRRSSSSRYSFASGWGSDMGQSASAGTELEILGRAEGLPTPSPTPSPTHLSGQPYEPGALLQAAREGALERLRALCRQEDADLSEEDEEGSTPLLVACARGDLPMVRFLCAAGASFRHTDDNGQTALHQACGKGHVEVAQYLCRRGADAQGPPDSEAVTPLLAAAFNGHAELVQLLQDAGACVDSADVEGWTPIYAAALRGHAEVVRCLLEAKANPGTPIRDGTTPARAAAQSGFHMVAQLLQEVSPARLWLESG